MPTRFKPQRRAFLKASATLAAFSVLPHSHGADIRQALEDSDLVYLTPIQVNGKNSRCQSEIWFVWDGSDIFVCTDTTSWRNQAAAKGLVRTNMWIGDVGIWSQSDGRYKKLPNFQANATIVSDAAKHSSVLSLFADKYPIGWLRWGSTFRDGLKNGDRSLIKYRPLAI